MDPVTILVMILSSAAGLLLARAAVPLFFYTRDAVLSAYRSMFEDHNLVILGGPQSGKTSLILLLTTGKPYFLGPNGEIIHPERTAGAVFVGKSASEKLRLEKIGSREHIPQDVGGEFIEKWKAIIREVDPHGIIYMIDGRLPNEQLAHAVDDIFFIIAPLYSSGLRHLRALHIFVNFTDQLSQRRTNEVIDMVTASFSTRASNPNLRYLRGLRSLVSPTHLSADCDAWPQTLTALEAFGTHMRDLK